MGGTPWSDKHYADRKSLRSAKGVDTFAYNSSVKSGKASGVHASLDPKLLNKAGKKVRESRDSDLHPESLAIATLFDVTGSMGGVPVTIQKELPKLMGLVMRRGIDHPQIMMGAIGDATYDSIPLQLGQFESGIEIDDAITNIVLEGGGGGGGFESYELALYFLANFTALDCFEKRGKKGYAFIIGDEMARSVDPAQVRKVIGEELQTAIPIAEMIREVQKMYNLFYIIPNMTSYYNDPKTNEFWKELLGQHFLKLDKPEGVCELIASTIAICESDDSLETVEDTLKAAGTDLAVVGAVRSTLTGLAKSRTKQGAELAVSGSGAGSGIEKI